MSNLESLNELLAGDAELLVLVECSKQVDRSDVLVSQKLHEQLQRITSQDCTERQEITI